MATVAQAGMPCLQAVLMLLHQGLAPVLAVEVRHLLSTLLLSLDCTARQAQHAALRMVQGTAAGQRCTQTKI